MSLTTGWGPFGSRPAGTFNFPCELPEALLYFEDSHRRVRVLFNGETVADSRRVKLLHETRRMPVYYFPEEDVRPELLEQTEHRTRCPHKGEASHWSIRVGDRIAENAVWSYPDPHPGAGPLAGYLAFYWDTVDAWYEEDEEVFVHPRDPYHRIDALPSSRHVRVSVGGEVVAETERSVLLFETALPTRYYFPPEDVRMGALRKSPTRTQCPYKGSTTAYWSIHAGDDPIADAAWSYGAPLPAAAAISGRIAFYNHKVELEVDGVRDDGLLTPRRRPSEDAS